MKFSTKNDKDLPPGRKPLANGYYQYTATGSQ